MFADLLPHPTFCADWYMVGWPASLIVPLSLTASLVTLFFVVARRGRPLRSVLVLVACVFLFFVADYVVYKIGCAYPGLSRHERDLPRRNIEFERKTVPSVKPTE